MYHKVQIALLIDPKRTARAANCSSAPRESRSGHQHAFTWKHVVHMTGKPGTTTYSIPEPFGHAMESLRQALHGRNLLIVGQLSLSDRIRRTLLINLDPCALLFIWPMRVQPCGEMPLSAGIFLPLHVVVSGRPGARTEVHVLRSLLLEDDAEMAPVRESLADLSQALQTIAMRANLVE